MAKKTEKNVDELLYEKMDALLEKLNKKLDKKLEDEKSDEEIYEERKEEIISGINRVANESKKMILCIGDGGLLASGSVCDILNLIGNVLVKLRNEGMPREMVAELVDKVYEEEE